MASSLSSRQQSLERRQRRPQREPQHEPQQQQLQWSKLYMDRMRMATKREKNVTRSTRGVAFWMTFVVVSFSWSATSRRFVLGQEQQQLQQRLRWQQQQQQAFPVTRRSALRGDTDASIAGSNNNNESGIEANVRQQDHDHLIQQLHLMDDEQWQVRDHHDHTPNREYPSSTTSNNDVQEDTLSAASNDSSSTWADSYDGQLLVGRYIVLFQDNNDWDGGGGGSGSVHLQSFDSNENDNSLLLSWRNQTMNRLHAILQQQPQEEPSNANLLDEYARLPGNDRRRQQQSQQTQVLVYELSDSFLPGAVLEQITPATAALLQQEAVTAGRWIVEPDRVVRLDEFKPNRVETTAAGRIKGMMSRQPSKRRQSRRRRRAAGGSNKNDHGNNKQHNNNPSDSATEPPWSSSSSSSSTLHVQRNPPSWGMDRIDQASLPLDGIYESRTTGQGVVVFVVDSGIRVTHQDFAHQREPIFCAFNGIPTEDCLQDLYSHGTHVAGIIAGATYGIAKDAQLAVMKVFDRNGIGSWGSVVRALDAAVQFKQANPNTPVVVNLSMGSSLYSPGNSAVTAAVRAGIIVASSAGNGDEDACLRSPASADGILAIGGSTRKDERARFSNFGNCVALYAPSESIVSAGIASDTASMTKTGNSMSSPHVAAVAALLLEADPTATPQQIRQWLIQSAVPAVLDFTTNQSLLLVNTAQLLNSEEVPAAAVSPTIEATQRPTPHPTYNPTQRPTYYPTQHPTYHPTQHPIYHPTQRPTYHPTQRPTYHPTQRPTHQPTGQPTHKTTAWPTMVWTPLPTVSEPTAAPVAEPTTPPTTAYPTLAPPPPLPTSTAPTPFRRAADRLPSTSEGNNTLQLSADSYLHASISLQPTASPTTAVPVVQQGHREQQPSSCRSGFSVCRRHNQCCSQSCSGGYCAQMAFLVMSLLQDDYQRHHLDNRTSDQPNNDSNNGNKDENLFPPTPSFASLSDSSSNGTGGGGANRKARRNKQTQNVYH